MFRTLTFFSRSTAITTNKKITTEKNKNDDLSFLSNNPYHIATSAYEPREQDKKTTQEPTFKKPGR